MSTKSSLGRRGPLHRRDSCWPGPIRCSPGSSRPMPPAGCPSIDVSPAQGKFLNLLVKISGARRILEIGTLGGYSTALAGQGACRRAAG